VAYDLVSNHDLILLPTFEIKQMSKKSDETLQQFLRRKTKRGMLVQEKLRQNKQTEGTVVFMPPAF
jgi:transposase